MKLINSNILHRIVRESINDLLLTESQESKSISAAKKLVMKRLGYDEQQADRFVRMDLRQDLPTLRTPEGGKFILGVTRMYCDGELRAASVINKLNSTLKYIASDAHINEYDRNLNGMSAKDLIDRFTANVEMDLENDRNEVGSLELNRNSDYKIVRINSFEQAQEYEDYTSWCVTHSEHMFNSYTSNGINQFYFCLKNGFEDIPMKPKEGCPLDEYGLSMIAVCVNEDGGLNTCTCRWNHDNGGNDHIMSTKQISEVIGMNFYDVFNPSTTWKEMLENAMQRLANGEKPYNVFDKVRAIRTLDDLTPVRLCGKWNFINRNNEIISPQWFDECSSFSNGFAQVFMKDLYNFINVKGEIISPNLWFDWCGRFREAGCARVEINDKHNFINGNGELLSPNLWFDWADSFSGDFAKVLLNDKINFLCKDGGILSPNQWFDDCSSFVNGIAKVEFDNNIYYIDKYGNITEEIPQGVLSYFNEISVLPIRNIIYENVINYIKRDMINEQSKQ